MAAMTPSARGKLLMYAQSITKDRGAAEFLVEDAIVSAARRTDMTKIYPGRLVGWIKIILRNKALDWLRRWKRVRTYRELHQEIHTRSTVEEAISREALAYFEKVVGKLPKAFRKVMLLRIVKELSIDEIAKRLKVSTGTVMSRFYRGRHMLMEWIKNQDKRAEA
jgi:RNA polymerase sigma-70 factor (ECF subfamily)